LQSGHCGSKIRQGRARKRTGGAIALAYYIRVRGEVRQEREREDRGERERMGKRGRGKGERKG